MNKVKFWFLAIVMLLFAPINAIAISGNLTVNCTSTEVKPGDTVNCTIKGTTDDSVGSLKMNVDLGSELSIIAFNNASGWQGELIDDKISLYNSNQVQNTFDIGTLSVKVSDSASSGTTLIQFKNIEFNNDVDNTKATIENKEVEITISNQTVVAKGLKSLTPTGGNFGVQFSSTQLAYLLTLNSNVTTFSLSAVAENASDTITFTNADTNETLDPTNITFATSGGNENMVIHIDVGSGDNKVTYSVGVRKDITAENGSFELSSLKVGDQTVTLISGKYEYNVTLNDISSYEVIADLKDRENYEIKNSTNLSPRSGDGDFTIIVSPKDSSSGLKGVTYTISVTKNSNGNSSPAPSSSVTPSTPTNPQTGGVVSVIMALILFASFGASIYYYKKNMGYFNN